MLPKMKEEPKDIIVDDAWWAERVRQGGWALSGTSRSEILTITRQLYKERNELREKLNKLKSNIPEDMLSFMDSEDE